MSSWATIKFNTEIHELTKSKYTFGRTEECDFKFVTNKLISSNHCYIQKDDSDNKDEIKAWLVDTSTNGCIINLKDKVNKNKQILVDNDKIYLAYKKNDSDKNLVVEFKYNHSDESNKNDETEVVEPKNKKAKIYEEDEVVEKKPEIKQKNLTNCNLDKDQGVEKKTETKLEEDYADQLQCTICSEIMHDCVSLQPCLHTFCAGCYSDWMEKSDECPICRIKVTRISKNHIVNNLIEAYLKNNPDKKRSDQDIKSLEDKNKITHDMLYPKTRQRVDKYKDDYEDSSEDEDLKKTNDDNNSPRGSLFASDQDEEDGDEYDQQVYDNNYRPGFAFNFQPFYGGNQFGLNAPYRFRCRQCPENKWIQNNYRAPDYTCTQNQNHILCQCCKLPMPDRNQEIRDNPLLPKQSCSMCFKAYCNLYWQCSNLACQDCLFKFGEMKPQNDILKDLINQNDYESQLFSDWLVRKQKSIQQLFEECVEQVKNGKFKAGLSNPNETLNKSVCRNCGYELFRELAYQYRENIQTSEFFDYANPRPNCYYGKNCRTQKHNTEHAKKYNHICEQSKFN